MVGGKNRLPQGIVLKLFTQFQVVSPKIIYLQITLHRLSDYISMFRIIYVLITIIKKQRLFLKKKKETINLKERKEWVGGHKKG